MTYTTAKKVFLSMERFERAEETVDSVSSGDTIELANYYPVNSTVTLTVDGNEQTEDTDYTVNYDEATIDYSGSDSGKAVVDYGFGPYSDSAVQSSIDAVVDHIDDYTNSTYNGIATVQGEVYDLRSIAREVYPFVRRPVESVDSVSKRDGTGYTELTEGVEEDYTPYQNLGIRFTAEGFDPEDKRRGLKVDYKYGYSDLPSDIERAATEMVVDDLVRGTVSGAMVDGRDNFDPQTVNVQRGEYREVLDRYRIMRLENMVNLVEKGSIS